MLVLWWLSLAWSKEVGIVVEGDVHQAPAEVAAAFADLERAGPLLGPCLAGWTVGVPTSGVAARARGTWVLPPWRRRVTVRVDAVGDAEVVWSQRARHRWTTTFQLTEAGDGTHVVVTTIPPDPGWPWRRVRDGEILPRWGQCWSDALERLDGIAPTRDLDADVP